MPIKFNLKTLLKEYNVTQKDLSLNTGIRLATISDICNNKIKQLPISALDAICDYLVCTPGELIEYLPPNTVDMSKISTATYNKLLLAKPFVGGVYKVNISNIPSLNQFFSVEYMLCVVVGNSLSIPRIETSLVVPLTLTLKDINHPFHRLVNILGIEYLAICDGVCSVNNSYLTDLCCILSLTDCINVKCLSCECLGLPGITPSVTSQELIPYYKHLSTHKDVLFSDTLLKNLTIDLGHEIDSQNVI